MTRLDRRLAELVAIHEDEVSDLRRQIERLVLDNDRIAARAAALDIEASRLRTDLRAEVATNTELASIVRELKPKPEADETDPAGMIARPIVRVS